MSSNTKVLKFCSKINHFNSKNIQQYLLNYITKNKNNLANLMTLSKIFTDVLLIKIISHLYQEKIITKSCHQITFFQNLPQTNTIPFMAIYKKQSIYQQKYDIFLLDGTPLSLTDVIPFEYVNGIMSYMDRTYYHLQLQTAESYKCLINHKKKLFGELSSNPVDMMNNYIRTYFNWEKKMIDLFERPHVDFNIYVEAQEKQLPSELIKNNKFKHYPIEYLNKAIQAIEKIKDLVVKNVPENSIQCNFKVIKEDHGEVRKYKFDYYFGYVTL